jgi:hypothetical protein
MEFLLMLAAVLGRAGPGGMFLSYSRSWVNVPSGLLFREYCDITPTSFHGIWRKAVAYEMPTTLRCTLGVEFVQTIKVELDKG